MTREESIIDEFERILRRGGQATDHYRMTLIMEALLILLKSHGAAGERDK